MLNYNLNIISTPLGRSNIGAGPDVQPTTTTTTTTTTSTTTTTTTTTTAAVQVRTDPYSGSLVIAIPGTQFGNTFGQTSFAQDISSYIRGTGVSYPLLSTTGSGTLTSATASNFSAQGYTTSMQYSGSIGQWISGSDTNFLFTNEDFTFESWINFSVTASANQSVANQSNVTHFYGVSTDGSGSLYWTTARDADFPGIRLVLNTTVGELVIDSSAIQRNANQWYHYAIQRSGSLVSLLYDGTVVKDTTFGGTLKSDPATLFQLMGRPIENVRCQPYRIQDYRVYKGIGKYSNATSQSAYTLPDSMVIG